MLSTASFHLLFILICYVLGHACAAVSATDAAVHHRFEGSRRSYSELWSAMEQHLHTTAAAGQGQRQLLQLASSGASHQQHGSSSSSAYSRHSSSARSLHWNSSRSSSSSRSLAASPQQVLPRINLVGSGDVRGLGVSPDLQPSVKLYLGLSYEEFYDTLCR